MRIRTQFILTVLLFGAVLAAISASAIVTNRQVEQVSTQEEIAGSIARGASELSYLANDYVMYRESQQLDRWQARFTSFSNDVASLQTDDAEQQALVRNIQANTQRLQDVFDSVVSAVGRSSQDQGGATDPAWLQVSWSRMAVQGQGLVSSASRLSQLFSSQVDRLRRTNFVAVVALIGVFGAYFLVNYFMIQRRILKSMAKLQAGTAVIGSGDLDFRIEEKSNDEIGDLSHAFNRMTAELKTAETALLVAERLTIAGKMAASLAHEINNPLQAVLGCLGLAQAALESGQDLGNYLQLARREVQRAARIVSQLHSLGRPVQGGHKESTDLNSLLDDVLVLNKKNFQSHEVEVIWEPDAGLPAPAVVPDAMRQVFLNLVLNAIDAMPEGGQLRLSTAGCNSPAGVRVAVADSGIGIEPNVLPHIFEAFYSTKAEGMGVGLFVCQSIVQQHGGQIEVESQPGAGTTVTVWLPVQG